MIHERRQLFLACGAVSATALAASVMKPKPRAAQTIEFEQVVPSGFSGWQIDPTIIPIKPTPDAQAALDQIYDQIVNRTYKRASGERVMLSIAYGNQQTDKLKAHRQEVCYAAQGFRISNLSKQTIQVKKQGVPVTRFMATLGQRQEPVSYWFTMGDSVVDSRSQRLLLQVRHGFLGEIPDGLLVRISSIGADLKDAYQLHEEFANALIAGIAPKDQQRFIGVIA